MQLVLSISIRREAALTKIQIKRIYDAPSSEDGFRMLVDRVWPRGMTKEKAALDLWAKDIAPSTELRKYFDHEASKWHEFEQRYKDELQTKIEMLREIKQKAAGKTMTLLYGAKDECHNQAVVLSDVFQSIQ